MKRLLLATTALLAVGMGSPAFADTVVGDITSDHCGCLAGQTSGGTVTVQELSGGVLDFTVALINGNQFNGGGFDAQFAFNLAGNPTITYTNLSPTGPLGFSVTSPQSAGSLMVDGYGSFEYGVQANFSGTKGVTGPLHFDISAAGGLTLASLESHTAPDGSNPFFAIDIFSGTNGKTGAVDVSSLHKVPGPIVGAGLPGLIAACAGLFGLNRRRKRLGTSA